MIRNEQATFGGARFDSGSLFSVPEHSTRDIMGHQCWSGDNIVAVSGFSKVKMNATYNGIESAQADAFADVLNNVIPVTAEPVVDLFETKINDSSIEIARLPCCCPYESSRNGRLDTSVLSHLMPMEETVSSGAYMNFEWQQAESPVSPAQAINMNNKHEFQSKLKGEAAASDVAPTPLKNKSRKIRERSKAAECRRRSIVSERVQAFQELLPASLKDKRGNQESILHNVIGHIKHLQLQLKELSGSRLGGESNLSPLTFLEGYGHYHPHQQIFEEPLEEILGSLIEENPAAAWKLLESKGLYMMPMASVDTLCSAE